MPAGAQASFGLNSFNVAFTEEDNSPATQAGSHPFAFTSSLTMNVNGDELQGRLRELFIDEMPGLAIRTFAVPQCREQDFETPVQGVNDCPAGAAVGIFQSAPGDPENWTTVPIFNLVPPPGVLMRLGFRVADVANVVVDFELSPESPYRFLVTVGEIPEAIELFAAKLQLWGVPASPSHDELRGQCALDGIEGSCPTSNAQVPLLTLPTSCEGPQETFYGALSWEGGEDWGASASPGFSGCRRLAFDPAVQLQLATEAAGTRTGLHFSVAFSDEGLFNPAGIAQSQVRDLVVALSGGVAPGPSLASAKGSCSEADLKDETPESAGCPATSSVGTAEVESPLVEGQVIHGAIYRATPRENFAGDAATALYVVLKDAGLGVSIAQPVALETDPATGESIAVAEEMPQLPFSDLRLHLDDGEGGPLVSPPFCGEYETEAEFDPWAGGGTFRTLSAFQISSGPNGGPCPTGAHEGNPESGPPTGGSPPAASGPGASHRHVFRKHRCRKGKRLVRRHGKARCVREGHRKQKANAR